MTPGDFSLVLAFGFMTSLHCVGMCGPIVLTYSVASNTSAGRRPLLGLHLAYNAGRTVTYTLLGAVAGLAGGAMGWVGRFAGIENIAAILAGCAMVLTGIALLGVIPGVKAWSGFSMPGRLLRPVGKLISSTAPGAKFALGLLMGFLPCGMIYAALMKAIGEATLAGGALAMFTFSIGTSVALVVVGVGSSAATRKLARWGTAISAITVLVMGSLLIARGALAGPVNHTHMHHMMM
jgi:hypothetical protein